MAQKSLTVAVISPDYLVREQLAASLEQDAALSALWTLSDYPGPEQLCRLRDIASGCVVFLDFTDWARAKRVACEIDDKYPTAATVAVQPGGEPEALMELMKLGIREVLTLPVTAEKASGALQRAGRKLGRESEAEKSGAGIYSFLPARPGSGATTIAVHAAAAAARSGEPVLLVDYDLRLGMTSFLLKLQSPNSILNALALGDRLENALWDQLICRREGLDVLGSAPVDFDRPVVGEGAGAVLDFARGRYKTICVDLPGEMRSHEVETLQRSKEIFLVCTSEVGNLHMAKKKAELIETLGMQNKVSIILNRAHERGGILVGDIEDVLRLPVRFTVPAGEAEISAAIQRAVPLEGESAIAQTMELIASRLTGRPAAARPVKTRRLLEFFSVTPVRDKVRKA